jgi:hypothetical protein
MGRFNNRVVVSVCALALCYLATQAFAAPGECPTSVDGTAPSISCSGGCQTTGTCSATTVNPSFPVQLWVWDNGQSKWVTDGPPIDSIDEFQRCATRR